jgi:hypothetical protein
MGSRIRFGEVQKTWVVETYMRAFGGLAEGCRKKKEKYFDHEKDVNHTGGGGC